MLSAVSRALEWVLEWVVIFLMIALTLVVIVAVLYRLAGASFSWYDEVAAIMLAWITYYGSALAALRRRHIGFDTVLLSLSRPLRMVAVVVAEVIVIGFFAALAWAGMEVLAVLEGDKLISLRWVPVQFTQSVIPIGAILFIVAELLSLPHYWSMTIRGVSLDHAEIEEEVASEMKKAGAN
ncbi:MAG: TRAP transporter small permease subunit [Thermohalobaculum sp.]|nr:TRAP transporter small permease subunit [Thermohalobaculum sp.]